jgi:hypothetical protein
MHVTGLGPSKQLPFQVPSFREHPLYDTKETLMLHRYRHEGKTRSSAQNNQARTCWRGNGDGWRFGKWRRSGCRRRCCGSRGGAAGSLRETRNGDRDAERMPLGSTMLAVKWGAAWHIGAQGAVVLVQLFSKVRQRLARLRRSARRCCRRRNQRCAMLAPVITRCDKSSCRARRWSAHPT